MNFFPKDQRSTFGEVLESYPDREFRSPARSTVPLLDALRQDPPAGFLRQFLTEAGLTPETTDLHLEYQVKPGKGNGTASHTDLMAIGANPSRSLAIEAKWTEPRYPTISKWLGKEPFPENKCQVLRGWLDQIEPYAERPLDIDQCGELVYQMVHRTASAATACGPSGQPAMAYLVFKFDSSKATKDFYRTDLEKLRSVVGDAEGFPFYLVSVAMSPTEAFREIADLKKGEVTTGQRVLEALAEGSARLFDFRDPEISRF